MRCASSLYATIMPMSVQAENNTSDWKCQKGSRSPLHGFPRIKAQAPGVAPGAYLYKFLLLCFVA